MNRDAGLRSVLAAGLLGAAFASAAQVGPERYGDRQQGQFGDPGEGFFGDPSAGEFTRYGFVLPPNAQSEAARRAREERAQAPYVILPPSVEPTPEQAP